MVLLPRFYGCDLVTGEIVDELQDLVPGTLTRIIGTHTAAQFTLPLLSGGTDDTSWGAPPKNWKQATEPGRTMIVVTLTGTQPFPFDEVPVWGGIVLERRGGTVATARLGCATFESYLDRRYVGDHDFNQQDEANVIATELLDDANDVEGIELEYDAPATGTLRDREYLASDDKTVFEALDELMGVENGIEWTIDVDWKTSDHNSFTKIVRVRDRLGIASPEPAAVFDGQAASIFDVQGDVDVRYEWWESYAAGRGANDVQAYSSGQEELQPRSSHARAEFLFDAGWPRYELHFQPSSSIKEVATLDAHSQRRLVLLQLGGRALTITSRADVYPVLGQTWTLGDDVGYRLIGPYDPEGIEGVARVIGWDLDLTKTIVSPVVVLPGQTT